MSSTTDAQPVQIRRAIKDVVGETDGIQKGKVAIRVSDRVGVPNTKVLDELERMERNGFAYLVNGEVKLP